MSLGDASQMFIIEQGELAVSVAITGDAESIESYINNANFANASEAADWLRDYVKSNNIKCEIKHRS